MPFGSTIRVMTAIAISPESPSMNRSRMRNETSKTPSLARMITGLDYQNRPERPEADMSHRLVLRLSHGPDDVERVGNALTVGSAALASSLDIELWLSNDGVELAKPGVVESLHLEHSAPLIDLWTAIVSSSSVYACSQCMLRRDMNAMDLREGVTGAGAAALVASVADERSVVLDF